MRTDHRKIVEQIERKFGAKLSYLPNNHEGKFNLPLFEEKDTGILFVYIPGGNYCMGLSEEERAHILKLAECPNISPEEMQPVQRISLNPFLISATPVLNKHILKYNELFNKDIEVEGTEHAPFFCDYPLAQAIAKDLLAEIPHEKEWEYFCRGGSQSVFCFGNTLPNEIELGKWLSWDFSSLNKLACNGFNLYGLFMGEWCSNDFTTNLGHHADVVQGSKTIRGGGAYFWPWQDEEWVYCISAFRMPSKDLMENKAAFRLKMKI